MKHEDKIKYMKEWCAKNNLTLVLEGEVGFGRECVGILSEQCGAYPDYWSFDEDYNVVEGEDVWIPDGAYHKHPCVAVLGRGTDAEEELYQWVKWFDKNKYVCVVEDVDTSNWSTIEHQLFSKQKCRIVKA